MGSDPLRVEDDFFKELLTESKKGFHSMFKQTYGVIYEQNSYVFSDLFNELEGYYARGKIDLAEAMDSFFNTLYQKMFTVLNAQYKFDDKYLGCVSEYMKDLKPFGDVPDKLSVQIKRSFVATRTFAQALNAAAEVAKNMITIRPSAECTAALTKMSTCGACNGHTERPCANFCLNVMKGCLQHYLELDTEWDNFVVNMERVSERLLGPFNIVMVVEPINIKISEAIMNFQETGQDISQQVFQGCGKPVLAGNGRRRRSIQSIRNSNADLFIDDSQEVELKESKETKETIERSKRAANPAGNQDNRPHGNTRNSQEIKYEPVKFARNDNINGNNGNSQRGGSGPGSRRSNQNRNNQNRSNFNANNQNNDNKEPHLDKLVKDIKQKIKDSKKFWSNLPYQTCNNEEIAAKPDSIDNCWNGKEIDRYTHLVASDQSKNPEFPNAANANAKQSNLIAQQLFTLRTTINHLRNAYNGMDVEWTDHEDGSVEYGSGSGSGSGADDDDDSGSGLGPYEFSPPSSPNLPSNVDHTTNTIYTNKPDIHDVNHNHIDVYKNSNEDVSSRSDHEEPQKPSSSTPVTNSPWRIRRVLFTYFLPIFVAWFGGICTTDLL